MSYCSDLIRECNQIINKGIMNTVICNEEETLSTNLISWFKKNTFEDVIKARNSGINFTFTIPIKGVPTPFDLGGTDAEQKFKQLKEHIDKGEVSQMSMTKASDFLSHNVSAELVSAWQNTMAKVLEHCSDVIDPQDPPNTSGEPDTSKPQESDDNRPRYGLQYQIDNSTENVTIRVFYTPSNSSDSYPIVESFKVIGGEVMEGALEPGIKIDNEKIIVVKQISNQSTMVLISTDKQDLDIKFTSNILTTMILKVFIFKKPISSSKHVYTQKVPKGYKIIGAGFSVLKGSNREVASCIPTSSYPSAIDEMTVKFSSKIENLNDQTLYFHLITVYDPNNQWDIKIFSKQTRRGTSVSCSPDSEYMMVGGGVQFSILGGNNESEIINQEDYRTGIEVCCPNDENTWEVKLTEVDLQRIPNWDLTCYAIGIKRSAGLESIVREKVNFPIMKLEDKIFFITSGGARISNDTGKNTYIATTGVVMYDQETLSLRSSPTGWVCFPSDLSSFSTEFTNIILAIRHSRVEFLPLYTEDI